MKLCGQEDGASVIGMFEKTTSLALQKLDGWWGENVVSLDLVHGLSLSAGSILSH